VSRALFDINLLIALFDELHQHHDRATLWLKENILLHGWASCPLTQNGFVRIMSQSRYVRPIPASQALDMLEEAAATNHHEFWPDDISLLNRRAVDRTRIHGPRQLTDIYLLALAVKHQGRLVTFDDSIPISAVHGATREHLYIL